MRTKFTKLIDISLANLKREIRNISVFTAGSNIDLDIAILHLDVRGLNSNMNSIIEALAQAPI